MQVIIVGSGKLGRELFTSFKERAAFPVIAWTGDAAYSFPSVVVHTGSGRELDDVVSYCERTRSILLELSTGSTLLKREVACPVVICPNTNILMLKFMVLLAQGGHHFKNYKIQITESHQADKSSVPGTAVNLAESLGVSPEKIKSLRDVSVQRDVLGIPEEYLSRHAYHRLVIEDGLSSVALETKVFGSTPYADGVGQIIQAVSKNDLEPRRYNVLELIDMGWL
ncbi:dihydrodipicolinate reductase [Limnohabitans curvus]|uniref:Dihydrodipicolinate reductase n=1 Tax=Limnohabitans curvus TaxID=323423 RepID=A0A315EXL6_9BURK|nr:dihydrodipicolinate reductase C-terminal domain-containing protein [Limnohabitans curvus]PUE60714.1 dihydrodipicolinate reductase [Limnohabitans curvus]